MVPENNSKFVDQVNYSLVRFMGGYLEGKDPYVTIFDRWFGPQAKVPLSKDLRDLVLETMHSPKLNPWFLMLDLFDN